MINIGQRVELLRSARISQPNFVMRLPALFYSMWKKKLGFPRDPSIYPVLAASQATQVSIFRR